MKDIIVIRGAGDLASGVAYRLHKCHFRVLMTEIAQPLVVRRYAAFANAILEGEMELEGVRGVKAESIEHIYELWEQKHIPVLCDSECKVLEDIKPAALVDAILAKKNTGTHRGMAPITVGLGPGFEAGVDVDAVVETNRGHNLGRVIYKGSAEPNTGNPGSIMGYSYERVLRSPAEGVINNICSIGDMVKAGDVVAYVGDKPVISQIDGVLRGLIANRTFVSKDLKIGDVDPRGIKEYCFTISDKARAIAGGVLEAVLALKKD